MGYSQYQLVQDFFHQQSKYGEGSQSPINFASSLVITREWQRLHCPVAYSRAISIIRKVHNDKA